MLRTLALVALTLLMLMPAPSRADWPQGGKLVMTPENGFNGVRAVRFLDLPLGDLAVVGVGNGGSAYGYSLQRIRYDGVIPAPWPASGVSMWQVSKSSEVHMHGFVVDDSSNLWHTFDAGSAGRIHLATRDGAVLPSAITPWSVPGAGPTRAHVAAGLANDVYFVPANGRLQRFLRVGTIAGGWPTTGVAVGATGTGNTDVIADNAGGAIVFAFNGTSGGRAFVTRIDDTAAPHAGWPVGGRSLADDDLGDNVTPSPPSQLLRSGSTHFLAVWLALETPVFYAGRHRVLVQRFGLDGALDPAWPVNGFVGVAMDSISALTTVADGQGGVYLLWLVRGKPRATHVLSNGTFAPGLSGTGVSPLDAGAQFLPTTYPTAQLLDELAADLCSNGDLMFAWNDARLGPTPSYRVRWLRPDLTADPNAPNAGVIVFPTSPHAQPDGLLGIHADPSGGALVAWGDFHVVTPTQNAGDIWMARAVAPDLLGVEPPLARPSALSLSAPRPNPARGSAVFDLGLPDDSPVRFELLDIAGRVLRSESFQGAGHREVTFAELGRLAPGLYFARVTARGDAKTVRVVVTR